MYILTDFKIKIQGFLNNKNNFFGLKSLSNLLKSNVSSNLCQNVINSINVEYHISTSI